MATPPQLLQKNMPMEALGVHYEAYISVMAVHAVTHLPESQGKGVPLEATHADRGY